MPMNDEIYGEGAWHLTHFILAMSSQEQRERVEMRKFRLVAHQVDQIPDHPDAGVWRDAPGMNLHMMPLWWRDDRPEILTVKALHDGKELALQLMWAVDNYHRGGELSRFPRSCRGARTYATVPRTIGTVWYRNGRRGC